MDPAERHHILHWLKMSRKRSLSLMKKRILVEKAVHHAVVYWLKSQCANQRPLKAFQSRA